MEQLLENIHPTNEQRESLHDVCKHIQQLTQNEELVLKMLLLLRQIESGVNPDVIPKIDKILSVSATVKCALPLAIAELDTFFKQKNVEMSVRREDDTRMNKNPNAFNIETGKSVRIRSDNCGRMKNIHHNSKQYTFYVPLSLMDAYVKFERLLLLVSNKSNNVMEEMISTPNNKKKLHTLFENGEEQLNNSSSDESRECDDESVSVSGGSSDGVDEEY